MGGKDSGREDSGSRNKETCNFDWKGLKKALQTQYHWGRVLKENIPLATKKGNASQLEVTIITKEKKKKTHSTLGKELVHLWLIMMLQKGWSEDG